jgi:hypothetical protein
MSGGTQLVLHQDGNYSECTFQQPKCEPAVANVKHL